MKKSLKSQTRSKTSRKEEILADAGLYTLASIAAQVVTLAAGVLTRRFLGPLQMGVWSLLQIILTYSPYAQLGVNESVLREIPFYLGKGDRARADEIKDLAFSFLVLSSVAVAAAVLLYAFLKQSQLESEMFYGLVFMSVLVILQRLNNLVVGFLRSYKHFSLASKQMVLSSIVNAALTAFLSQRFHIYGFLWAMAASFLFNIFYILAHCRFNFRLRFDFQAIWRLMTYGLPFMVVGFVATIFVTIDKLMIARMLGLRELGLYSVAILTYATLGNLPNSIGIVLIPNFHQKFGETGRPEDLKNYLLMSSLVFSDLMPLFIGAAWIFVPYAAARILPDFSESIEPMRALILSAYFLALAQPYSYFLAVVRKQILLLPVVAAACFLAFASNYVALSRGYGLVGVGLATTTVFCVRFIATYFLAAKRLFKTAEMWRHFAMYMAKFIYMTALLTALWKLWPESERSMAQTLTQALIFIIFYIPILWKLDRDLNLMKSLLGKFKRKWIAEETGADA